MKSNFKFFPAIILGALASVGCNVQYPSSYLSSNGPNPAMVINFENGLTVSSNLAEANRPGNKVLTAGTIVATGSPLVTPIIVSSGAANTANCVHMQGPVTDPGNATYPAVELVIPLEAGGNGQYDASLFSGIKFYLKVASDDNAGTRSFSIPIVKTSPAPAGTCSLYNSCYNNFAYAYSSTNGNWQLVILPFTSLARASYGGSFTPSTMSGTNLQQILSLQWSEGNNNVAGTINVDFYVDEVQFF